MDTEYTTLLTIIFIISALVLIAERYQRSKDARRIATWEARENLPQELRSGALFMSEKNIRMRIPLALHGRVDQVYRLSNNELCVVDTKMRKIPRVYPYDIIQGSVYARILRSRGYKTHQKGYVRCESPTGKVRYVPYKMLSDLELQHIYDRYQKIMRRPSAARMNRNPLICQSCGYNNTSKCSNPDEP